MSSGGVAGCAALGLCLAAYASRRAPGGGGVPAGPGDKAGDCVASAAAEASAAGAPGPSKDAARAEVEQRNSAELLAEARAAAPGVEELKAQVAQGTADLLLAEVARRNKALLYVVANKTNDHFSLPNLTKYLRMKGIGVEEAATPEEAIVANASKLVAYLDMLAADSVPRAEAGAPLRHELAPKAIPAAELETLFPEMKEAYVQQPLDYGRNSRYGDKWRISCYLVVMENWKPKIMPHEPMVRCMASTMHRCCDAFAKWYCRVYALASVDVEVMNAFVTRYRAVTEEDQLKKHIDGSNVDGSTILALPTDDPFEGGALHVWDGKPQKEFVYQMKPGDLLFMDNAVWHQAKPISMGERWALVLFLRLKNKVRHGGVASIA